MRMAVMCMGWIVLSLFCYSLALLYGQTTLLITLPTTL